MKRHPVLDAHEIIPNLWQGSFPEPGDGLRLAGLHVLVLCARELQVPAADFPGVQVVHAPNDDISHLPLGRGDLQAAISAARQASDAVQRSRQVLVTCAAGLNRSGLVSALTLHLLLGWGGKRCAAHVQGKRMTRDGRHALYNQEFVRALCRLPERGMEVQTAATHRKTPGGLWLPR